MVECLLQVKISLGWVCFFVLCDLQIVYKSNWQASIPPRRRYMVQNHRDVAIRVKLKRGSILSSHCKTRVLKI